MAKKDKSLIFRVDDQTVKLLKDLAKKAKRSNSDYLRLLIEYASENKLKI